MGRVKIFCQDCSHFDSALNLCNQRNFFIKYHRARYCQDYIYINKKETNLKPISEPVKPMEEEPIKTKLELNISETKPIETKVTWWQKLIRRIICLMKKR